MAKELISLAYRDDAMTVPELTQVAELTQAYWRDYPDNDKFAGPGSYLEDDGPIYASSLPVPDEEAAAKGYLDYWLTWLTDVTRALPGARWNVTLDGAPLSWDEETGWQVYAP